MNEWIGAALIALGVVQILFRNTIVEREVASSHRRTAHSRELNLRACLVVSVVFMLIGASLLSTAILDKTVF